MVNTLPPQQLLDVSSNYPTVYVGLKAIFLREIEESLGKMATVSKNCGTLSDPQGRLVPAHLLRLSLVVIGMIPTVSEFSSGLCHWDAYPCRAGDIPEPSSNA